MTRVVLLGASNVAIGLPTIVRQLGSGLPGPLRIFAAFGHGRSYCDWSRVLFRALPGIDQCALWDDLDRSIPDPGPTLALLTDVGNDLIYGLSPERIAGRVESCLARLARHEAQVVITRLPLASIRRLSSLRFHATKAIFFPRTKGSWPDMLDKAHELDERLAELAARISARLIDQPLDWYGLDPIHIRRGRRSLAWRTAFSSWSPFQRTGENFPIRLHDQLRLRLAAPAERRLFGRSQYGSQPGFSMGDIVMRLY